MRIKESILIALALAASGALLSAFFGEYWMRLLNIAIVTSISVIGFNFAFGLAGLISLGHAAFVGFGAYTIAILTTSNGWSPWAAIPVAVAGTMLFAALIGYPLLRLKGHYLALATLGVNVSFVIVANNWIEVTGGTNGIANIEPLSFFGFTLDSERQFLVLSLTVLSVLAGLAQYIKSSRLGRAMIAVRDDETAALMTGVNVPGVKLTAFMISACFAAISGVLFATHVKFISPEDFAQLHSIMYLAMLIVGGEGYVLGAVVGAFIVTFLPEALRFLGDGYLMFFGVMLVITLIFVPNGVVGLVQRFRKSAAKKKSPLLVAARKEH